MTPVLKVRLKCILLGHCRYNAFGQGYVRARHSISEGFMQDAVNARHAANLDVAFVDLQEL